MQSQSVARLINVRRNLTAVLLNLPIRTTETSVASLLGMLDYFADNPDEYFELINDQHSTNL